MATPQHTPIGRGYMTTTNYFHHANDYYTFRDGHCPPSHDADEQHKGKGSVSPIDLWHKWNATDAHGHPAVHWSNSPRCSNTDQDPGGNARCVYEDSLFETRVLEIVEGHPAASPLFLFYAPHIVHGPLQVPTAQEAKFDFIDVENRRKYHAMVNFLDGSVGKLVDALKAKGMYNDTLIVFSSDNGGPLPAGNNYPRKGGKFSDWEGGIRVAAFVSGGFLPAAVRGTKQAGLAAGWDWFATFCALAGVDPHDARAAAAKLPPIDSLDLWPLISGENATSPRTRVVVGSNDGGDFSGRTSGATRVGAIVEARWKIIVGDGPNGELDMACWPVAVPRNT